MMVGAPLEMILNKKTPEMNELEPALKFLKIWAHNFENQKSCSQNKMYVFLYKKA